MRRTKIVAVRNNTRKVQTRVARISQQNAANFYSKLAQKLAQSNFGLVLMLLKKAFSGIKYSFFGGVPLVNSNFRG